MKKNILCLTILLWLSGCVSTKTIPFDESTALESKPTTISKTTRNKPDFSAMTAGKAMFGLIGGAAMISAGNDIVQKNDIEDPANYIRSEISKALVNKYGLEVVDSNKSVDTRKTEVIAKAYSESDWILDIETINWSFAYFPTDWNNYRVMYSAKLKLIDTKSQKVLAEGFCSRVPEYSESAPSHDELLANKAERIKSELKIAADNCITEFKTVTLKI